MTTLLTLDEIFAMAVRIESNGVVFYRAAAAKANKADADYLMKLAAMEDEHKRIFGDMRKRLASRKAAEPPRPDGGLYMAAIADGCRFEGSAAAAGQLTGKETMADVLRLAIHLEKESVLFYLGIRDVVPAADDKAKVDQIIEQEKSHIATLAGQLKKRANG